MNRLFRANLILLLVSIVCLLLTHRTGFSQNADGFFKEDRCIACHIENEIMPEGFNKDDIHLQSGLSCAGCHGGDAKSDDPEIAMSAKNDFIGNPAKKDLPRFCGKCHSNIGFMRKFQPRISTDQESQYFTSQHGELLAMGDDKVADCVSCHSSHAIFAATDPRSTVYPVNVPETCNKCHGDVDYMSDYDIPADQFEKYARSVHGVNLLEEGDIGAPACNDCHGNHGAVPPGIASVSHVCGNCHVNNLEYFSQSPMSEPFEQSEIHACEQCHGYHEVLNTSDEMVGVGDASVCTDCHSEGDKGYETAGKIYEDLSSFVQSYNETEEKLIEVQQKGMDDVDILFLLQEAHQTLIHSRTLVHTFDPEKIREKTNEGKSHVQNAAAMANQQISEYYTRRRGFGVAIVFIFALAIALIFKIREFEKEA